MLIHHKAHIRIKKKTFSNDGTCAMVFPYEKKVGKSNLLSHCKKPMFNDIQGYEKNVENMRCN